MKAIKIVGIIVTACLLMLASSVNAQFLNEQDEFEKKWVFGGDFGLGFSNYGTNIMVSPQVGYRITPAWEFGTRLTYNYYSYNQNRLKFATHNYGGGLYTTYEIYRGIFAHMENELLSYERVYYDPNSFDITNRERLTIHSVFVGGGIRQYFGGRAFASFTILYNLNETPNTPYTNPLYRIGFGFGL